MNLKNSRFYKRIQELRRISKDRIRKSKRCRQVDYDLEKVFQERNGNSQSRHSSIANNDLDADGATNSDVQNNKSNSRLCGGGSQMKRSKSKKLKSHTEINNKTEDNDNDDLYEVVEPPDTYEVEPSGIIQFNNRLFNFKLKNSMSCKFDPLHDSEDHAPTIA